MKPTFAPFAPHIFRAAGVRQQNPMRGLAVGLLIRLVAPLVVQGCDDGAGRHHDEQGQEGGVELDEAMEERSVVACCHVWPPFPLVPTTQAGAVEYKCNTAWRLS